MVFINDVFFYNHLGGLYEKYNTEHQRDALPEL
jgi:hypothetical protein